MFLRIPPSTPIIHPAGRFVDKLSVPTCCSLVKQADFIATYCGPDLEHVQMRALLGEEALNDSSIACRHVRMPPRFPCIGS